MCGGSERERAVWGGREKRKSEGGEKVMREREREREKGGGRGRKGKKKEGREEGRGIQKRGKREG